MMIWKKLTKTDVIIYKGIAILIIVLHNFMHLFPTPKEMEFDFYADRFNIFLNSLGDQPEEFIRIIFSYFGHFGVQIFIFLSAYGLTKKYLVNELAYIPFIRKRFANIYPSFLFAILIWAIVTANVQFGVLGPLKVLYWSRDSLILKITLLSNFIPNERLSLVGPWWFISFIFQFYLIFPLLLKFYIVWKERWLIAMSILSIIITMVVNSQNDTINLYFTVIAHLPELCLGMYFAKNDEDEINIPVMAIFAALIIYILGNIYELFWYMNHISFLILLLFSFKYFVPKCKNNNLTKNIFIFLGGISLQLFLVNGFLRWPFLTWAINYDHWLLTLALCLVFLIISIITALIIKTSERFLFLIINRYFRIEPQP